VAVSALAIAMIAAAPASAAKPKLSVADASIGESAGSATVLVSLSKRAKRAVKVGYATGDGSARAGSDYADAAGTLKLKRRKRSAAIAVPLIADHVDEPDETLVVTLGAPRRAKIADGEATLTIVDDDPSTVVPPRPTLTVSTTAISEGGPGTNAREIGVALSGPSSAPVSVDWSVGSGTAIAGVDFAASGGTVSIPAGSTTGSLTVDTLGDDTDEFDETLVLQLSNAANAELAQSAPTVTLTDDDAEPTVALATASVAEGSSGAAVRNVAVDLSAASGKPITVNYATASGTATSGTDFQPTSGQLTFAAGDTSESFGLSVIGDSTDEFDETVGVSLTNPVNVALPGGAQSLGITDDDAPPTVSVSTASVPEGTSGSAARTIAIGLSAASAKPITVNYATANTGTATSPADFAATSGSLSFIAGDTSENFSLTVVGDYSDEPDETAAIGFSAPVNVSPAAGQSVTIVDDDPACVSADPIASATILSTISGDSGTDQLTEFDEISPCGDTDWYRVGLREDDGNLFGENDLTAAVTLFTTVNDSPQFGDLELCGRVTLSGTPSCSTLGAGQTEQILLCVNDELGPIDDENLYIEVDGFGDAVNDYTLQINGNVAGSC
jgi:hypothetical protein